MTTEDYFRMEREYWRQVEESDGFNIENVSLPSSMNGMITGLKPYYCERYKHYPYSILVKHYASVGLLRYNILKGTSFEFGSLIKFNMLSNCLSSFFMTLVAHDRGSAPSTKTFQIRVDEATYATLDLTCSVSRHEDDVTTKKPFIPHFHGRAMGVGIFKGELPDWPSDDDLNDGNRFYVLKKSEWKNYWVYMYLELVVCANDRSLIDTLPRTDIISQLEIVKVTIETGTEDVEPEPLKAKNAIVYITFKGLEEARAPRRVFETGKHVERQAIVRRVIDEDSGYLTLIGKLCGGRPGKQKRPRVLKSDLYT